MKKKYNVNELHQKNKEIIAQNQAEMSQTIQENIPRDTLEEADAEIQEGAEEEKGVEEPEEKDQFHVEVVKDFFKNGVENVKTNAAEKNGIFKIFNHTFDLTPNPAFKKQKQINEYFIKMPKEKIDNTTQDDKKK